MNKRRIFPSFDRALNKISEKEQKTSKNLYIKTFLYESLSLQIKLVCYEDWYSVSPIYFFVGIHSKRDGDKEPLLMTRKKRTRYR